MSRWHSLSGENTFGSSWNVHRGCPNVSAKMVTTDKSNSVLEDCIFHPKKNNGTLLDCYLSKGSWAASKEFPFWSYKVNVVAHTIILQVNLLHCRIVPYVLNVRKYILNKKMELFSTAIPLSYTKLFVYTIFFSLFSESFIHCTKFGLNCYQTRFVFSSFSSKLSVVVMQHLTSTYLINY
jgi:hypothetical protein